ncbi:hypothetical protein [Aliiroseovarius subalbicans]|uniref:hypothetical protein n=1 Tax=Aliiroseovarius subalbicans TaxID=2925840 RepID=UPI001F57D00F|nr:hypothetical protein [Aliiroseovarius subalbicans]MCI2399518.1 hypothetical protein [Aliiroseovarius subalbicans]
MKKSLAADGPPDGVLIGIGNVNDHKDRIAAPGAGGVPGIVSALFEEVGLTHADLWVSRMGGSEQVAVGWVDGDRPFDFTLPGRDDLGLRGDAEILPFQLVHAVLARKVSGSLSHLRRIHADCPAPLIHLESPPPIADTSYAQDHLDVWFKQHGATPKVAPAALRLKLWLLQTRLARAICDDIGVRYIVSPPGVQDKRGFLTREFWSADATHGNIAYGRMCNRYLAEHAASLIGVPA